MASSTSITDSHYDIVIVGAGIAGPALAHALSELPSYRRPLRIALLERSLAEPDRIVGELLQPGGVLALRELGLEWTLEGIEAIPVHGYCVVEDGKQVHIPYPAGYEGRSFHHGRFVMKLREAAFKAKGVDVIEATVTELIEDPHDSKRIIGVYATKKVEEGQEPEKVQFLADLVVIADGCFSNFRTAVMGESGFKPVTRSHFVGAILEDVKLPIPQHGTVALVQGSGPVLLYQISEHDTRILIDVQQPLPSDLPVRHRSIAIRVSPANLYTGPHPQKHRPPTPLFSTHRYRKSNCKRPPPPNAQLFPPSRRTERPLMQEWRHPPWRCLEHATSSYGWWHDCRSERRRATARPA